jgi:hypothetical protein
MHLRALIALLSFLTIPATALAPAPQPPRGPFLLAGLASLGEVSWRCEGAPPAFALEFRAFRVSATMTIALRARGSPVVVRVVQPGERVRLPALRTPTQRLTIMQRTKPGTLRALLDVDFRPRGSSFCWPYLPPGLTLRLLPRR